jgi:hypothetical protein
MPVPTLLAAALLSAILAAADAPAPRLAAPTQPPANPSEDGAPPAALFTAAPPSPGDLERYDAAIHAAAAAADSLMGPLDGGWRLTGRHGRVLYRIEIADRGLGPPTIEGAWRDLQRHTRGSHCGYLSIVVHRSHALRFGFQEPGAAGAVAVTLRPSRAGWRGELRRGRRTTRVTLTRG